ncbi:carboxypeptidase PM20D1 [Geodermatophilus normandii]|uniref:Carboxypeptidase PM20D1 n=1 Tax=Geodermatophilus normandii TaxID=1137989 RepID=A0A317QDZ3_9ACTN|nr:M20/M25/M40 family metallo-hydrolase [Geodermatophilus normandii]PWW21948.1 carboxypeptidase PM20D1 [Geodermatophilus normandii]
MRTAPLLLGPVAGVAAGAAAVARRVARFRPLEAPVPPADASGLDADAAAARLGELIRIPTVSSRDPDQVDAAAFARFRDRLAELYPHTHRVLEREVLDGGALLWRWRSGTDRPPLVLMAHHDVVPVTGQAWTRDPFSGAVEDGWVHGRGAVDDKGSLVAVLEAVESLAAAGHTPARDVYVSSSNDEEVLGVGAQQAVQVFRDRGIEPWAVVDEGGAVVTGVFPGVPGQIAVVGLAEKGLLDVDLVTSDPGGHASSPTPDGAPARLARAILRLDAAPSRPGSTTSCWGWSTPPAGTPPARTGRCSPTPARCDRCSPRRWRGPAGRRTRWCGRLWRSPSSRAAARATCWPRGPART